jgi:hypothetical protein
MKTISKRDLELCTPLYFDVIIRQALPGRNPFTENNRQNRVIFIHIPKNAGRSIYSAVLNESGRHIPLRRYYAYDSNFVDARFKFAVVRHPVDRFVSAFNGLKGSAKGEDEYSRFVRKHIEPFASVEDFVVWMASSQANTARVLGWLHFWPQHKWVTVGGGVMLDEILYFESLNEYWPAFADLHGFPGGLPFIGKARKKCSKLEPKLDVFLRDVYRSDFELFGYL